MAISENSNNPNQPAVRAENAVGGDGVFGTGRRGVVGISEEYQGVFGKSKENAGVVGESDKMHAVFGITHSTFAGVYGASDAGGSGVTGESKTGRGVHGTSETGDGVFGKGRRGVVGVSDEYQGVFGWSRENAGVVGESDKMHAVFGITHSTFAGVYGASDKGGAGVVGESNDGDGMVAKSMSSAKSGIFARNEATAPSPDGIPGGNGVFGLTTVPNASGVFGANNNGGVGVAGASENGIGILGRGRLAGRFEGDVEVTGDLRLLNADCAEDFDIADPGLVGPGTVMVLGDEGELHQSQQAYDKRVAGVVSGAGDYKPGIVLDKQDSSRNRKPIALLGKVYCKVDAEYGAIEVGDLLTTSPTSGHAMKVADPLKAFGAVIGKALRPLLDGQGLIPILIALQ